VIQSNVANYPWFEYGYHLSSLSCSQDFNQMSVVALKTRSFLIFQTKNGLAKLLATEHLPIMLGFRYKIGQFDFIALQGDCDSQDSQLGSLIAEVLYLEARYETLAIASQVLEYTIHLQLLQSPCFHELSSVSV